MAERRATNKYYPPDWTPGHGSINKFVGQHPLRDRARKLDQGILIIRFELPYNIWCGGCGNHIGMGVRYNAEKKKIGMYYTTPIFSFRMKCHLCDNWFEIHTDPKNSDYVIASGATRKVETWDPAENGTAVLPDAVDQSKMAESAFYRAEHAAEDEQRGKATAPSLERLLDLRQQDWADPFTLSQKMRTTFRVERKRIEAEEADAKALADKHALAIAVLPRAPEDAIEAKHALYRSSRDAFHEQHKVKRLQMQASSIFDSRAKRSRTSTSPALVKAAPAAAPAARPRQELAALSHRNGINPRNFRLLDDGSDELTAQARLVQGAVKVVPKQTAGLVSADYTDDDDGDDDRGGGGGTNGLAP